ncbi:MAG: DUF2357 domain-containing protein [Polyangiaceae bacterium]|nr:DUF2357 domain-containing protein [Polyangiaceae bacterium]
MIFHIIDVSTGKEALRSANGIELEENRRYELLLADGGAPARAWLGDRELEAKRSGSFGFEIGFWAGGTNLRIVTGDQTETAHLKVTPSAEKLSVAAWLTLLSDLEAWLPGLAVGLESGGIGGVSTEGSSAPILAAALLPLVPDLVRSAQAIASAPRDQLTITRDDVPMRIVRRADRETLNWLVRHSEPTSALHRWRVGAPRLFEPQIPQALSHRTVDHPANRFVAWLIAAIANRLRSLSSALDKIAKRPGLMEGTKLGCRARASAAQSAAEALDEVLQRTFFRHILRTLATDAAILALHDDPIYGRFHALARPFLSPRFRLENLPDGPPAPARASFDLYELWTFLSVKRALQAKLAGWSWSFHPQKADLELIGGFGNGTRFEAMHQDGSRLDLWFNLKFTSYLRRRNSARYSISRERRPDIVVTLRRASGEGAWICLDAKYRVKKKDLAQAFESLHIYRDSLHHNDYGGACRGGLLLAPAMVSACAPWFSDKFRKQFDIGAWRLTPGDPEDLDLASWILATLGSVPS